MASLMAIKTLFLSTTAVTCLHPNDTVEKMCMHALSSHFKAYGTKFFGKDQILSAINITRNTILRQQSKLSGQVNSIDMIWLVSDREWNNYRTVLASKKPKHRHGRDVTAKHPISLSPLELSEFIRHYCGKYLDPEPPHTLQTVERTSELWSREGGFSQIEHSPPMVKWVDDTAVNTSDNPTSKTPFSTDQYHMVSVPNDSNESSISQRASNLPKPQRKCARCGSTMPKQWTFLASGVGLCQICLQARDLNKTVTGSSESVLGGDQRDSNDSTHVEIESDHAAIETVSVRSRGLLQAEDDEACINMEENTGYFSNAVVPVQLSLSQIRNAALKIPTMQAPPNSDIVQESKEERSKGLREQILDQPTSEIFSSSFFSPSSTVTCSIVGAVDSSPHGNHIGVFGSNTIDNDDDHSFHWDFDMKLNSDDAMSDESSDSDIRGIVDKGLRSDHSIAESTVVDIDTTYQVVEELISAWKELSISRAIKQITNFSPGRIGDGRTIVIDSDQVCSFKSVKTGVYVSFAAYSPPPSFAHLNQSQNLLPRRGFLSRLETVMYPVVHSTDSAGEIAPGRVDEIVVIPEQFTNQYGFICRYSWASSANDEVNISPGLTPFGPEKQTAFQFCQYFVYRRGKTTLIADLDDKLDHSEEIIADGATAMDKHLMMQPEMFVAPGRVFEACPLIINRQIACSYFHVCPSHLIPFRNQICDESILHSMDAVERHVDDIRKNKNLSEISCYCLENSPTVLLISLNDYSRCVVQPIEQYYSREREISDVESIINVPCVFLIDLHRIRFLIDSMARRVWETNSEPIQEELSSNTRIVSLLQRYNCGACNVNSIEIRVFPTNIYPLVDVKVALRPSEPTRPVEILCGKYNMATDNNIDPSPIVQHAEESTVTYAFRVWEQFCANGIPPSSPVISTRPRIFRERMQLAVALITMEYFAPLDDVYVPPLIVGNYVDCQRLSCTLADISISRFILNATQPEEFFPQCGQPPISPSHSVASEYSTHSLHSRRQSLKDKLKVVFPRSGKSSPHTPRLTDDDSTTPSVSELNPQMRDDLHQSRSSESLVDYLGDESQSQLVAPSNADSSIVSVDETSSSVNMGIVGMLSTPMVSGQRSLSALLFREMASSEEQKPTLAPLKIDAVSANELEIAADHHVAGQTCVGPETDEHNSSPFKEEAGETQLEHLEVHVSRISQRKIVKRRSSIYLALPQSIVSDLPIADDDLGSRPSPIEYFFAPFLRLYYAQDTFFSTSHQPHGIAAGKPGQVMLSAEDSVMWALLQIFGKADGTLIATSIRVNQFMKLLKETKLPGASKLNVNQIELLIRQAPTVETSLVVGDNAAMQGDSSDISSLRSSTSSHQEFGLKVAKAAKQGKSNLVMKSATAIDSVMQFAKFKLILNQLIREIPAKQAIQSEMKANAGHMNIEGIIDDVHTKSLRLFRSFLEASCVELAARHKLNYHVLFTECKACYSGIVKSDDALPASPRPDAVSLSVAAEGIDDDMSVSTLSTHSASRFGAGALTTNSSLFLALGKSSRQLDSKPPFAGVCTLGGVSFSMDTVDAARRLIDLNFDQLHHAFSQYARGTADHLLTTKAVSGHVSATKQSPHVSPVPLLSVEDCKDLLTDFGVLPRFIDLQTVLKIFRCTKLFEWNVMDLIVRSKLTYSNPHDSPKYQAQLETKANPGCYQPYMPRTISAKQIKLLENHFEIQTSTSRQSLSLGGFLEFLCRVACVGGKLGFNPGQALENLLRLMNENKSRSRSNGKPHKLFVFK